MERLRRSWESAQHKRGRRRHRNQGVVSDRCVLGYARPMTPQALLSHIDSGQLWPAGGDPALDVAAAYQRALEVRKLREARGEQPRGYKIGFTNRTIWPIYNVFAPIWGTVWDSTLVSCEGRGELSLARTCQPRLEPETVFG